MMKDSFYYIYDLGQKAESKMNVFDALHKFPLMGAGEPYNTAYTAEIRLPNSIFGLSRILEILENQGDLEIVESLKVPKMIDFPLIGAESLILLTSLSFLFVTWLLYLDTQSPNTVFKHDDHIKHS